METGDRVKTRSDYRGTPFRGIIVELWYNISYTEYKVINCVGIEKWFDNYEIELDNYKDITFKIGDKVKTKSCDDTQFCGKIIDILLYTHLNTDYKIKNECGCEKWFDESRLELVECYVTSEKFKFNTNFKVGDKVRTNALYNKAVSTCEIKGVIKELEFSHTVDGICYYIATICNKNKLEYINTYWLEHYNDCKSTPSLISAAEASTKMHECLQALYKDQDVETYKKEICEKNKLILNLEEANRYLRNVNTDKQKTISNLMHKNWEFNNKIFNLECDMKKYKKEESMPLSEFYLWTAIMMFVGYLVGKGVEMLVI